MPETYWRDPAEEQQQWADILSRVAENKALRAQVTPGQAFNLALNASNYPTLSNNVLSGLAAADVPYDHPALQELAEREEKKRRGLFNRVLGKASGFLGLAGDIVNQVVPQSPIRAAFFTADSFMEELTRIPRTVVGISQGSNFFTAYRDAGASDLINLATGLVKGDIDPGAINLGSGFFPRSTLPEERPEFEQLVAGGLPDDQARERINLDFGAPLTQIGNQQRRTIQVGSQDEKNRFAERMREDGHSEQEIAERITEAFSVSLGRLAASVVSEPGTIPFNIISGGADAVTQILADPTIIGGRALKGARVARRTFGLIDEPVGGFDISILEAARRRGFGLIDKPARKSILPVLTTKGFVADPKTGGKLFKLLADEDSISGIKRILRKAGDAPLPRAFLADLATIRDPADIKNIWAGVVNVESLGGDVPVLGGLIGKTPFAGPVSRVAGAALGRTFGGKSGQALGAVGGFRVAGRVIGSERVPRLFRFAPETLKGGEFNLDNFDDAFGQVDDFMASLGLTVSVRDQTLMRVARVADNDVNGFYQAIEPLFAKPTRGAKGGQLAAKIKSLREDAARIRAEQEEITVAVNKQLDASGSSVATPEQAARTKELGFEGRRIKDQIDKLEVERVASVEADTGPGPVWEALRRKPGVTDDEADVMVSVFDKGFEGLQQGRAYWTAQLSNMYFPGARFSDDLGQATPTAHSIVEYLNRRIPLPDMRELRRATSSFKYFRKHLQPEAMLQVVDIVMVKAWRPSVLFRPAFTVRTNGEEMLRLGAAGLDSLVSHPFRTMQIMRGKSLKSLRGIKNGKQQLFELELQHADAMTGRAGQSIEGVLQRGTRKRGTDGWFPVERGEPHYNKWWFQYLARQHKDPTIRAAVVDVDGAIDDFVANHALRRRLADNPDVPENIAPVTSTGEALTPVEAAVADLAAERYVRSLWARAHEATGGKIKQFNTVTGETVFEEGAYLRRLLRDELPDLDYDVLVPGDPNLLEAIMSGFAGKVDLTDVTKVGRSTKTLRELGNGPKRVPGQIVPRGRESLGERYDGGLDTIYGWIGARPTNALNRNPTMRQFSWQKKIDLIPFMDEPTRVRLLQDAEEAVLTTPLKKRLVTAMERARRQPVGKPVTAENISAFRQSRETPFVFHGTTRELEGGFRKGGLSNQLARSETYGDTVLVYARDDFPEGIAKRLGGGADIENFSVPARQGVASTLRADDIDEFFLLAEEAGRNPREILGLADDVSESRLIEGLEFRTAPGGLPEVRHADGDKAWRLTGGSARLDPALAFPEPVAVLENPEDITTFIRSQLVDDLLIDNIDIVDELALTHGLYETKRLLYDLNRRHQYTDIARNINPFLEAFSEILTTWARLAVEDPVKIGRRFQQTVEGARESGFFFENDQGEEMFAYPGGGLIADWMLGSDSAAGLRLSAGVTALNLFSQSFIPGFAPMIQLPAAELLSDNPPGADFLRRLAIPIPGTDRRLKVPLPVDVLPSGVTEFLRETIIPFNQGTDPLTSPGGLIDRALIPAWFRRILIGFNANIGAWDRLYGNTVMELYAADQMGGRTLDANPEQSAAALERAKGNATTFSILRGIIQAFAPASPQITFDIEDKTGKVWGMGVLADELRARLEADDFDTTKVYGEFIDDYGVDPFLLLESKTDVVDRRTLTKEGLRIERKRTELFEEFPHTAYFAAVDDPDDDFDYGAYIKTLKEGTRLPRTPEQFRFEANHALASFRFQEAKNDLVNPDADANRVYLSALKAWLVDAYPGYDPGSQLREFAKPSIPSNKAVIKELEEWGDDKFLSGTSAGIGLAKYFEAREEAKAAAELAGLKPESFATAKRMKPYRDWLRETAIFISKQPESREFGTLWTFVLQFELNDDAEEGQ